MKRVLQKNSRIVRRVFLEHQTEFEIEFHIEEEKSCRDQEPGSNGEDFTPTTSNHSVRGGNRSAETVSKCEL